MFTQGSVAVEGVLRDAESGEPVAAFADREAGKVRPFDLQSLTWWGHARESFEDWADQLVELLNSPDDHRVADSPAFTPLPF